MTNHISSRMKSTLALLASFSCLAAHGEMTVFNANNGGKAAFDSATGGVPVVLDFDSITPGSNISGMNFEGMTLNAPGAPLIVVRGDDTFTPSGSDDNVLIPTSGGQLLSPGGVELGLGPNPQVENDDLEIVFENPVTQFGMDILWQSADFSSNTDIKVYDAEGSQLVSETISVEDAGPANAPAGTDFWGIVTTGDDEIARISINERDGNGVNPDSNIGYDTMRTNVRSTGFTSQATLVGNEIEILSLFPTLQDTNRSTVTTVDDTDTDRLTFGGGSFAHANRRQLIFSTPNATVFDQGSADADGGNFIEFRGLSFGDSSVITGVSLSSTFGGITAQDLEFGADFVRFDVAEIAPAAGDFLVIDLTTSSTMSPVPLVSAVLPASRSVSVGSTATAFATIINPSPNTGQDCSIAPSDSALAVDFFYQATDPLTNAPSGDLNTPVEIAAGAAQSFIFGITPQSSFGPAEVEIQFNCINSTRASSTVGLNTLLLAATNGAVADVVGLAATIENDGIVRVNPQSNAGAFSVASINLGSAASLQVSADTGDASLPVELSMCQTDQATGQCINPATPTSDPVSINIGPNETPTFSVFVVSTETVPLDPANNRVFVRFVEVNRGTRGATSVAVTAQ